MISYVSGPSNVPLLGETIGQCLDRIAATFGDRDALVSCHQQVRYSYHELHTEVERVARGLLALGVARGDRVGIWSANRAEWVITQYAAAKAGAILVNVNPAYRLRELEYALAQSGVSVLIAAQRFRNTDYAAMLKELVPARVPSLRTLVYLDSDEHPGAMNWEGLRSLGDTVTPSRLLEREAVLEFDDPVNIQYTSGTTGAPKGATLSHHNILNNGFFVGERVRYTSTDRVCLPVPFYHCFGCVREPRRTHTRKRSRLACRVVRRRIVPASGAGRAMHIPLRRTEHVHCPAGSSSLFTLPPRLAADWHHGGCSVPGRGHAPGH